MNVGLVQGDGGLWRGWLGTRSNSVTRTSREESKVIDSCGGSRKTVSVDIHSILQTEQGYQFSKRTELNLPLGKASNQALQPLVLL